MSTCSDIEGVDNDQPPARAQVRPLHRVRSRFACSAAQRRFWVLDRIDPGNPALNIAVRWRLEGRVAIADLEHAFTRIIERHQALRTFIAEEDGAPVQIVEPHLSFRIPDIDLSGLGHSEALAEAERIAQLEARASFDLSSPPLIRATHLRLPGEVSILLVTAHHIVCDGWSIGLLAQELGTICRALHDGVRPQLPSLALSYGEYADRQAADDGEAEARAHERFWVGALEGAEYFELVPDRPRPALQSSSGNIVSTLLPRELAQGLQELSRRAGGTLFMTALSALLTMLHRHSGALDISIGSQVAGRDEVELENLVGMFTNTIVLRGDLSGDPPFLELMAQLRDRVSECFEHVGTPLDRLIEILKPRRDLGRSALFSMNFIFQRTFVRDGDCGSFRLVDMPSCSAGAMHDLNFFMVERAAGWRLSCEYNTDLFEQATIERMLGHFRNLLVAAVADPEQRLSAMPMLDAAERRALVVDCNRTAADYPRQLTLPALFAAQAARTPDAVAVTCGERSLSYRELDLAANRLARELLDRGVGRGSLAAICLDRSPDLLIALLAVLKAGAAYVPVDPAYPAARIAQIVDDARPAALLTRTALADRLPAHAAPSILLDAAATSIAGRSSAPIEPAAIPADLAYVIYTSGSTGRPKGVPIRHQALTNLLWSMRTTPGLDPGDTLVAVTTISFDIAALELFLPLVVGARLVIAEDGEAADGEALLNLLRRHGATVMQATPVTWQLLLAAGWNADPPLKMLCGGEALTRSLADRLLTHGDQLWNLYGPTETTIWSSALRVQAGTAPVLLGPPIANTQFYVLDSRGQLAPTGAPGELVIGGDGVAPGYLNLPDLSHEKFVADTFREVPGATLYRTGDLVRRRGEGRIEFLGRADQQVKLRGYRIELGEIESTLRAQPQVSDCVAVIGVDAAGEGAIRAYVVARPASAGSGAPLVDGLHAALRQALPGYMCPSVIVVLESLPRTPNGKVDRAALPLPRSPAPEAAALDRPRSDLEQRLGQIWCTLLGIPAVALDANFFEVGGHSLLAVRLLARIGSEFGRKLSLATLFKHPTIAGQAALLEQGDPREFDFRQVVKLQPNGLRPALIAINNTGIYYALSKHLGAEQPFTSLQLFDPALPQKALPQTLEEIAAGYAHLIRRVQRTGPYALLGWCVAGTLAFEIARQLTASGQSVSQLVLFDTLAPGHLRRLPWLRAQLADYSYRWKLIVADWTRTGPGRRRLATFLSRRILVKKLLQFLTGGGVEAGAPPAADSRSLSPEQYDQWLLNYLQDAAAAYEPKPYAGTMTLFRSSCEPAGRFLDPKMGWGDFVEGGIEVAVIAGDHFSIFQEPSVSQVALRIESAIDAGLAAT